MRYAKTTTNREAGRKFGLDESNVRRWVTSQENWKKTVSTRKAFRGPKCSKYPELEARVLSYIQDKRKYGMPVSREIIQLKAMEIAKELNMPRREFRGSIGWCRRFMRRSGLALRRRTTLAQRLPADFEEKLVNFQRYVIQMRQRHLYPFHQIGNADETPVFFDMASNTTVDTKGVKSVLLRGTGNEKNRITVMLAVTAEIATLCDSQEKNHSQGKLSRRRSDSLPGKGLDDIGANGRLALYCLESQTRSTAC